MLVKIGCSSPTGLHLQFDRRKEKSEVAMEEGNTKAERRMMPSLARTLQFSMQQCPFQESIQLNTTSNPLLQLALHAQHPATLLVSHKITPKRKSKVSKADNNPERETRASAKNRENEIPELRPVPRPLRATAFRPWTALPLAILAPHPSAVRWAPG